MTHYTDEDLVLYYYGEAKRPAEIERHLAECSACADIYRGVSGTLGLIGEPAVPARDDRYGLEVWQRIRHELPAQIDSPWMAWLRWDRLALAGAAAALVIAAFVAGRVWSRAGQPQPPAVETQTAAVDAGARARTAAISDHLERSERVLLDLINANGSRVDVRDEQAWAADLVDANRLYRDAALRAGDTMVAGVLDDLERQLIDIVHAPSTMTAADIERLRVQVDAAALLFKVRVLHDELRERESAPAKPRKTI